MAFSPDGRWLATASGSKPARIWDVASMQIIRELTVKKVFGVAFSPDGRWLATAGKDGTARIWDAASGQEFSAFYHGRPVRAVMFSPDSLLLGTASDDKTARVWDVAGRRRGPFLMAARSGRWRSARTACCWAPPAMTGQPGSGTSPAGRRSRPFLMAARSGGRV